MGVDRDREFANYSDEELARFEAEVARMRQEEIPRVHDEEIKAAAQRAVTRELEIKRENFRDELEEVVEQSTRESAAEERHEAIRTVPYQIVILVLLLVVVGLWIAATHPGGLASFFGLSGTAGAASSNPNQPGPLQPQLGNNAAGALDPQNTPGLAPQIGRGGDPNAGGVDPLNSIVGRNGATVDALFWARYTSGGGVQVFGLPLDAAMEVNGRKIQWFQRARMEYWPEHSGTPNEIQLGRLGSEFTDNRAFPQQQFFASRADLRYFPETAHAVGEPFLSFWEQNGGLAIFGFPISEVVQEELPDGIIRNVQYFERARLEEHTDEAEPGNRIMIGLLGNALYLNESQPKIIEPLRPTPVPIQ